jgi:hypothetical protein
MDRLGMIDCDLNLMPLKVGLTIGNQKEGVRFSWIFMEKDFKSEKFLQVLDGL